MIKIQETEANRDLATKYLATFDEYHLRSQGSTRIGKVHPVLRAAVREMCEATGETSQSTWVWEKACRALLTGEGVGWETLRKD